MAQIPAGQSSLLPNATSKAMSDRAKRADKLAALAELKRTRDGGARKWKVRHRCDLTWIRCLNACS